MGSGGVGVENEEGGVLTRGRISSDPQQAKNILSLYFNILANLNLIPNISRLVSLTSYEQKERFIVHSATYTHC